MKKFYFTAGWKMYSSLVDNIHYAEKLKTYMNSVADLSKDLKIIIFPDLLSVYPLLKIFNNNPVEIGTPDLFWEDTGAYTGEVSPFFLNQVGCNYSLVGHPERIIYLKEDSQMINKKVKAALRNNIVPFLIVVENKDSSRKKIISQVRNDFLRYTDGLKAEEIVKMVIIYEPIWAISTTEAAAADHIIEMVSAVRSFLNKEFGSELGKNIHISYGGGVNEKNFNNILKVEEINGIGLGKSSLDYNFFTACIKMINDKLNKN